MIKIVDNVEVEMTDQEIAQRQAEEAAWAAGAKQRDIQRLEESCGLVRWQRDLVIAALSANHPKRIAAEQTEAAIAALR